MTGTTKVRELDSQHPGLATRQDVERVFGAIDEAMILDIMNLQPTVQDLEQASSWLGGDPDVFGPDHALHHVASKIVAVLTADEEDESRSH